MRRIAVACLAVGAFLLVAAAPAFAVMTSNPTPCEASATFTSKGGTVTTATQDSDVIKVPREGSVAYTGSVGKLAQTYTGQISLDLGLFKYTPGSWSFKGGPQRDPFKSGNQDLPTVLKYVPPGKYKVSGFRTADGETCAGYATIELEGSVVATPAGIGVLAVSVLSFLGLLRSGFAKR